MFADETLWAGDKRSVGALKRLITEPTLTIERKGIDAVQEKNCVAAPVSTSPRSSRRTDAEIRVIASMRRRHIECEEATFF